MLTHWMRQKINRLYHSHCHLCQLPISHLLGQTIWCEDCAHYFSPAPSCQRCGLPTLTPVEQCGSCLSNPPPWHRLYCISKYQQPISSYIHQIKYQGKFQYNYDLATLLVRQIENPAPVMTYVPLHWTRYLQRGYNQSAILTHYLYDQLVGKFDDKQKIAIKSLFKRVRSTPSQQTLNRKRRTQNLRHAFHLKKDPDARHVAIVDDVVTTGSTLTPHCKLLKTSGVEVIDIYCLCRTPEPD